MATRPTTDRIRESLFNILAGSIQDRRVLDLFAGTGALGIEAISRGAASAVFVDQARAALAAIRRNIRDLGLDARTRIIHWDIRKNLNCLASDPQAFDLVFMDPPYETHAVAPALRALISSGAMAPDTPCDHRTQCPGACPSPYGYTGAGGSTALRENPCFIYETRAIERSRKAFGSW
jgi:16S rRNA (guanine966-N2)-methyltransferase